MVYGIGASAYVHTAYANSSDGTDGFSLSEHADATYVGQYTDRRTTDSQDPAKYQWSELLNVLNVYEEEPDVETEEDTSLVDLTDREVSTVSEAAGGAQETSDTKTRTYQQPEEPDPEQYVFNVGDLWYDTDDGNHVYRWDGSAWVDAQDSGIEEAKTAASGAQSTADGKNTVYYQTSKPTGGTYQINDLWFDTDDGSKMYYWDGSTWTEQTFGASALSANSVTAEKIVSGAITTEKLAANSVTAEKIDVSDLFAQDITTEKLSVELQRAEEGYIGMYASFDGDEEEDIPAGFELLACDYQNTSYGNAIARLALHRDTGSISCYCTGNIDLSQCETLVVGTVDAPCLTTAYTSFSGGVVSSGSVVVTKKLGWCQVFGEFTLTGTVSDWTEILAAAKVPAPQHGANIYPAVMYWGSSFLRLPRVQINGSGGLRVRYGATGTYDFSAAYPIE